MTEDEKLRTIIMMKQMDSLGILDSFIMSLAAGDGETQSEKEACKELAQRFYECADSIKWETRNADYIKNMIKNSLEVTDAELENNNEE